MLDRTVEASRVVFRSLLAQVNLEDVIPYLIGRAKAGGFGLVSLSWPGVTLRTGSVRCLKSNYSYMFVS